MAWHWAPEEHCHNKWKENPFSKRQTGAYNKHFPVSQVLSHRGLSWTWFRIDPVSFSNNFFRERCRIKSGMTSVFITSSFSDMKLGFVWNFLNKRNQQYQLYYHTGQTINTFRSLRFCRTGLACPELDSGTRCLSLNTKWFRYPVSLFYNFFEKDAGSSPAGHSVS